MTASAQPAQPCRQITLALTGASGMPYALRLLQCLTAAHVQVNLLVSRAAQVVIGMETELQLPGQPRAMARYLAEHFGLPAELLQVYGREQWDAPVASGTAVAEAMVVCPCTTGTLAAIAQGNSDNLIERAADVSLKERRPLILVLRETPLSIIHLENMLRLARAGATIMPANPGFYHMPQAIDDLVDFIAARVLDHLRIPHQLLPRWGQATADLSTRP